MIRVSVASAIVLISFLSALALPLPASAQDDICIDTTEGRICRRSQPLRLGELVNEEWQRQLGLVSVGGGCSGTLISDYWVLTAQHCVSVMNVICGPLQAPSAITISAAWSARMPTATSIIDYCASDGLDIALVELGGVNFGDVPTQLFFVEQVEPGARMQKFGRGFSTYASTDVNGNPVPGLSDGQYRMAFFTAGTSNGNTVRLEANVTGQVGHGGDSGGPDHVVAPNGVLLGIASVQSTCSGTGMLPGAPGTGWAWATGISGCNSAAVVNIRHKIIEDMWRGRTYECTTSTPACGATELMASRLLLLK